MCKVWFILLLPLIVFHCLQFCRVLCCTHTKLVCCFISLTIISSESGNINSECWWSYSCCYWWVGCCAEQSKIELMRAMEKQSANSEQVTALKSSIDSMSTELADVSAKLQQAAVQLSKEKARNKAMVEHTSVSQLSSSLTYQQYFSLDFASVYQWLHCTMNYKIFFWAHVYLSFRDTYWVSSVHHLALLRLHESGLLIMWL